MDRFIHCEIPSQPRFSFWCSRHLESGRKPLTEHPAHHNQNGSYNIPHVLRRMAKLTAGDARAQREVADADTIILPLIGKAVLPLGHGAHKDADAFVAAQPRHVVPDAHDRRVEAQRHLAAVRGQVVRDVVLDHLQELLLGGGAADREAVEELHHEAREALEGARDADGGGDFDEDVAGGVDVDLELAGFVDGGVEEREEALLGSEGRLVGRGWRNGERDLDAPGV